MADRFVIEVFVTAVDDAGDEQEVIKVISPKLASASKDKALIVAEFLGRQIERQLRYELPEHDITRQYPKAKVQDGS